jgi:hypothetical protein
MRKEIKKLESDLKGKIVVVEDKGELLKKLEEENIDLK